MFPKVFWHWHETLVVRHKQWITPIWWKLKRTTSDHPMVNLEAIVSIIHHIGEKCWTLFVTGCFFNKWHCQNVLWEVDTSWGIGWLLNYVIKLLEVIHFHNAAWNTNYLRMSFFWQQDLSVWCYESNFGTFQPFRGLAKQNKCFAAN